MLVVPTENAEQMLWSCHLTAASFERVQAPLDATVPRLGSTDLNAPWLSINTKRFDQMTDRVTDQLTNLITEWLANSPWYWSWPFFLSELSWRAEVRASRRHIRCWRWGKSIGVNNPTMVAKPVLCRYLDSCFGSYSIAIKNSRFRKETEFR